MRGKMLSGKRYNTLNDELFRKFGEKVSKIAIDGGFTCPNRDGTISSYGCLFCNEKGSGDFSGALYDIDKEINNQIKINQRKWNTNKFIAYFQAFTNTYADVETLKQKYESCITRENVVGLAVATRPDAFTEEIYDYLEELNDRTFLWVELGLQTVNEDISKLINRGYNLVVYENCIYELKKRNIKVVTHLIFGLPYEDKTDMLNSVKFVANTNTWGIKFHSLYIQTDSRLYDYYIENQFELLTKEEYVDIVALAISYLPKEMVIHRLTGDANKKLLFKPEWCSDKLSVISSIDKRLKELDLYQGFNYNNME
jgi:hypothetical protein